MVAAWNMNGIDPSSGSVFGASMGTGWCDHSAFGTGAGSLLGTSLGAIASDPAGESLSFAGSSHNGESVLFAFDTIGYHSLTLQFAARRSGTGFSDTSIEYWSGDAWTSLGSIDAAVGDWALYSFDLASIGSLDDGGATLRFVVDGATSGSGSIRFDNVVVTGMPVPAPGGAAILSLLGLAVARGRRRVEAH